MRTISVVAALAVAIMLWVAPGVEAFLRLHLGGLPASGQTSGCPPGMTCLTPTGNPTTDTPAIQAAVNANYAVVVLLPGTFKLNAPIVINNRNVYVGSTVGTGAAGLGGSVSPYPAAVTVDCSALATSGLNGCFTVKNQSARFSGFHILGNSTAGLNCISVGDSGLIVDGWMILDSCRIGIYADAAVGGASGYALNEWVKDTFIPYAGIYAVECICTDSQFGPNIDIESMPNNTANAGIFLTGGAIAVRVVDNLIDSGFSSACVAITSSYDSQVMNNYCEQQGGITSNNSSNILISGNMFNGSNQTGTYSLPPVFQFFGPNAGFHVDDNHIIGGYSACYSVDGAATVSSSEFSDNHCNITYATYPQVQYANAFTESQIDPQVTPHPVPAAGVTNSSLAFAAPDWQYGFNAVLSLQHGANSLPNPVYTSNGQSGTLRIVQSPAGGDTIGTYGNLYQNPQTLSSAAYVADIFPFLTDPQGNIVIGAKLASVTPSANLLTGGNAMTSGWSTGGQNSTGGWVTNVVADPVGTTTAARFIEDVPGSGSIKHTIGQSVSLSANTTYTCSVWFSQGTSGNRNIAIQIYDASFGNGAWVFYNGANGANIGQSGGTIIASGNAGVLPPGYVRPYLTFSLATAPANLYFYLVNGTALQYTGDGASNGYFWGPTCRLGSAP